MRLVLSAEEALNVTAQRQYRRGRRSFILIYGILLFALPMFCVMTGFAWSRERYLLHGMWLIAELMTSLAFWCGIGYLYGWIRWRGVERRALRSQP